MSSARRFLEDLREEVRTHPAVNHPFLARLAVTPFSREDYLSYGLQHYPLVHLFTTYLERLLYNAPDSEAKLWLARVLCDEYGEGSEGHDHPTLYRRFLRAAGAYPGQEVFTPLATEVTSFLREHIWLSGRAPFLVGLGAVGPGHEWAIPHMFPPLITGLRRAGFAEDEIGYFTLHIAQDENHGAWLEEALARYSDTPEAQEQVRRGTLLSLEARRRFWLGVERRVVAWRQPHSAAVALDKARAQISSVLRLGKDGARSVPLLEDPLRSLRSLCAATFADFLDAQGRSAELPVEAGSTLRSHSLGQSEDATATA